MEIKSFTIHNLGRFTKNEPIRVAPTERFSSNITVFVGDNGAGKTIILKALATSLSWFIARLRTEKGNGTPIPEEAIANEIVSGAIDILVTDAVGGGEFKWRLAKTKQGRKGEFASDLSEVNKLADYYRNSLTYNLRNTNLPLIAFYPVERVVLDIPLKIRGRHSFEQLDGYENSLSQGVDFRRFFEWFREREDIENQPNLEESEDIVIKTTQQAKLLSDLLEAHQAGDDKRATQILKKLTETAKPKDAQLNAVRVALSVFLPDFENLRVNRKPTLHMAVDKDGESFNISQLSQGEKSLMALVGDIARRLAMMNPALDNPLLGKGVILIDEVDMHLHPSWQRSLVSRFIETFPNCQFVLTTHSPLVISDNKDILVYSLDNGTLDELSSQYGKDANTVLVDVMDTESRNEYISYQLNDLLDAISISDLAKANELINILEQELPRNHIELVKARLLLRKQELRSASH